MEQRTSLDPVPRWVPVNGHALRHVGIHFDAVRAIGMLGEQIAYEIMQFTDLRAGPIVRSGIGGRGMYFLLPPDTASTFCWPPGTEALNRSARGVAFIGVPALHGETWPLDWRSRPSSEAPFVDAGLLHELAVKVTGVAGVNP
ncbi:hypothetical protein [Streptomyces sp. TE33382]